MTVFESVQKSIGFGWRLISCNNVSLILAAITTACNSSLGMVNELSFNGVSLDLAK